MTARTPRLIFIISFAFYLLLPLASGAQEKLMAPTYPCRIHAEFPHDTDVSTQGLFYLNGHLYESSGGFGKSFLVMSEPDTGRHVRSVQIDRKRFAEGITLYKNKIFMLTWLSGTGYIHSLDTLELLTSFAYRLDSEKTEGWGLIYDGSRFILSSGSNRLRFYRPEDFARIGSVTVHDGGKPIRLLNELEYVGGMVLANIWKTDRIAVIDPNSGTVKAWIDLSPLRERISPEAGVANGIAYDEKSGRLFVTGKHWDKLFVVTVDEVLWRQPVSEELVPATNPQKQ
ncbi:glutaminyl-peptide cyclotransferase [uncultured Pseudodesulfovibrio sp.]|uniref:glutaminyl-peptide cyclotransferase n=1 Tax=uncultured Pseudodesulfovibrio sp. TaxID=2035858 RepID=UPI0029C84C7A|nr:glutaminyl-peptide cyclotransferase [uncultured Pseudodesulfovibrio sp.]